MPTDKPKLVVVTGPTASGKSGLAMKLCPLFSGEIVIADSRQIYKGLSIGTSKPTKEEQELVPHHLVDIRKPGQDFTVADFQKLATEAIGNILAREQTPWLVGGTAFYIDALTQGLSIPPVPPNDKLRSELEELSLKELVSRLAKLDPEFTNQVDKKNKRRLVRAIEVCEMTGQKFSKLRRRKLVPYDILYLGIKWPREELYTRIDQVVNEMMAAGLEREIQDLLDSGSNKDWLIKLGLEYRFITQAIIGELPRTEAITKLKFATHQFAKRQITWLRRNQEINWLEPNESITKGKKLVSDFLK